MILPKPLCSNDLLMLTWSIKIFLHPPSPPVSIRANVLGFVHQLAKTNHQLAKCLACVCSLKRKVICMESIEHSQWKDFFKLNNTLNSFSSLLMPADQINWLNELKERISDDYWKKKKKKKCGPVFRNWNIYNRLKCFKGTTINMRL